MCLYYSPNQNNLPEDSKNNHTLILFGTMRGLMREMTTIKNKKLKDAKQAGKRAAFSKSKPDLLYIDGFLVPE